MGVTHAAPRRRTSSGLDRRPAPTRPDPPTLMGKTLDRRSADNSDMAQSWKLHDAFETYGVKNWGKGYFGINKLGHVTVHPDKSPDRAVDLKELVDQLQHRGIQ